MNKRVMHNKLFRVLVFNLSNLYVMVKFKRVFLASTVSTYVVFFDNFHCNIVLCW